MKNPYEEAVKWIEKEVRKNGVFNIERCEEYVDVDNSGILISYPNHKIRGFTVSSQHTDGKDYNILQLINTMKIKESKRNAV
jgi:hypothetical protein